MKVIILQRAWELKFGNPGKGFEGHCDHPEQKQKKIIIDKKLTGKAELECIVHEIDHARDWAKDEEFITAGAKDLTEILWKLGYRRLNKEQMKILDLS